jgi:Glycosyltransferase family 87
VTGLRIGRERVRLYGFGLALIGLTQLRFVASVGHFWDWVDFYVAGSTVGTRALLDPAARATWGAAHGIPTAAFAYLPGFAWVLAPAAHLSIGWGFALNAVLMAAAAMVAARVAARVYSLDTGQATFMTIGWAPVTAAIVTGQNSPLGLLLSVIAIDGLARDDALRAGFAVGALAYKPTYALAYGVLLLVYRKWKALAVVAACMVGWYVLSAAAAGADWWWPATYVHGVAGYIGPDFAYNRFKSISIPGLLMLVGLSSGVAFGIGIVGLVASLAWLKAKKVGVFQAASLAGAIGVATSAHAWAYDAAVALPALWWVAENIDEPAKTRAIAAAYLIAPLWMASHALRFDPLAIVVVGGGAGLLALRAKVTEGEGDKGRG